MITVDKMDATKATVEKLIAQGRQLTDEIAETVTENARLTKEAEDREQVVDRLNGEVEKLTEANSELEARNTQLAEDVIRLESQLNDAVARLQAIHETSNNKPPRDGADNLKERLRTMPFRSGLMPSMPGPKPVVARPGPIEGDAA